jgi:hypothetical protein
MAQYSLKIIFAKFHQIMTSGLKMGVKTISDIFTEQVHSNFREKETQIELH